MHKVWLSTCASTWPYRCIKLLVESSSVSPPSTVYYVSPTAMVSYRAHYTDPQVIVFLLLSIQTFVVDTVQSPAHCCNRSGVFFVPFTTSGNALVKCGETQKQIGGAEREFIQSAAINFLTPFRNFLEGDFKTILVSWILDRCQCQFYVLTAVFHFCSFLIITICKFSFLPA